MDSNGVIVAVIIALFVIAAIIGVSVGVTRSNRNNEPAPAPAPTEAPALPPSGIDPDCEQVEKKFSVPGVVVGMAVTSDISENEINYAASVLQKTYASPFSNPRTPR